MKCIPRILALSLMAGCVCLVGCDGNGAGSIQSLLDQFSGSSLDVRDPQEDSSVADVSTELNGQSSNTIFSDGASRARVRNESDNRADINLYFYTKDEIVHSAYIQIHPGMVTLVASLKKVDSVELTGEDVSGRLLDGQTYHFGVDFDAYIPAEYVIRADGRVDLLPGIADPGTNHTELPDPEDDPLIFELREPALTIDVFPDESFMVRWEDSDENENAFISFLIDPDQGSIQLDGNEIDLGVMIEEIDTENQLMLNLPEGILDQSYRVLGVITDGPIMLVTAAPGGLVVKKHVDDNQGGNDEGDGDPGGNDDGEIDTLPDIPIDHLDSIGRISLTEYLVQAPYILGLAPGRVIINNVLSGGSLEIELSTDQWVYSEESGLMLIIPDQLVPADVTPRTFDVMIELVSDRERRTIVSDYPIYIE